MDSLRYLEGDAACLLLDGHLKPIGEAGGSFGRNARLEPTRVRSSHILALALAFALVVASSFGSSLTHWGLHPSSPGLGYLLGNVHHLNGNPRCGLKP